jgi:biotin carboxylase
MVQARPTLVCISSYFKGNRFLQRAKREGARVFLVTMEAHRHAAWDREHLDDLFVAPLHDLRETTHGLAYLMRKEKIDRIVALDDFDVETAAALREHFRLPGFGQSTSRYFRDKLAMRMRARECGFAVPEFVPLWHHEDVRRFLTVVPPPWLMKPRHEASSIGIKKMHSIDEVWRRMEELGDDVSFHLLERFIPSDLFHVDSLVVDGKVVFAEVGEYHRPLLEVWTGGGVFGTRTLRRDSPDAVTMKQLNARLLPAFGLESGCSHTEFLRSKEDGRFYFLETSARVGGACISDMVEAATGLNVWEEWAAVEVAGPGEYRLPALREEFAGTVVSLARQERPDTSGFNDPEVFFRLNQKHHVGLVVRSDRPERVAELLEDYSQRIIRDYQAVLPPATRATM